jgi:hypothetical protein
MTLKPVTLEDRPQIESWIAAEPTHQDNTFEFYQEAGTKSVMCTDAEGEVFVLKFTPCLRTDIDFSPTAGPERIGKALAQVIKEMTPVAKSQGFKEFCFESSSPSLIEFCGRLGFRKTDDYRKVFSK